MELLLHDPDVLWLIARYDHTIHVNFTKLFPLYAKSRYNNEEFIYDHFTGIKITSTLIRWYFNGKLHRGNDLPAVEYITGTKIWYYNGLCHRDNGLHAVEYISGTKIWYYNGLCHRDNDLPAVEFASGDKYWYCNGLWHRDNDLPAAEYISGNKMWYKNGECYREQYH